MDSNINNLIFAANKARVLLAKLRDRGTIGDAPEIRLLARALNEIEANMSKIDGQTGQDKN